MNYIRILINSLSLIFSFGIASSKHKELLPEFKLVGDPNSVKPEEESAQNEAGTLSQREDASNRSFKVIFQPSGRQGMVSEGTTLLEAARQLGTAI